MNDLEINAMWGEKEEEGAEGNKYVCAYSFPS